MEIALSITGASEFASPDPRDPGGRSHAERRRRARADRAAAMALPPGGATLAVHPVDFTGRSPGAGPTLQSWCAPGRDGGVPSVGAAGTGATRRNVPAAARLRGAPAGRDPPGGAASGGQRDRAPARARPVPAVGG